MQTEKKSRNRPITWLMPVVAALMIVVAIQLLEGKRQTGFQEIPPVDGVLDLTDVDLSHQVINVPNSWDFYPDHLYDAENFASGTVDGTEDQGEGRYGTYRLLIKAPPRQYYTLCSYSIDYSTRVFVNGTEVYACGIVADNAAESVPQIGYMTIPLYSGDTGEIEIIYQYANFVHRDGGFIQPTYLSTPQNMEEFKEDNNLASLMLSGGLLFLSFYFLLCAAVQRRWDFFLLAVCCLLMALRDQNFLHIHLLAPAISWYVSYRVFMGVTSLLPGMLLFLLRSIYPSATKRLPALLFGAVMLAATVLIAVLPTMDLVNVCVAAWVIAVPYLIYLAWGVARYYLKEKKFSVADGLTLGGFAVLVGSVLLEGLYVNNSSAVSRYGIMPIGMLFFTLLTAISISLRIQAQKAALAESRSRSEMLERMNEMNLDFLHNVAHELKTPLTVISGYAQLTGLQISANHISNEMPGNLKTIQHEALRLADMVTKLMDYSYGHESETPFGPVEVKLLLESVQAICTPMCLKNKNRVVIEGKDCSDIYGNRAMLLQIFINLVVNANRHTESGVITVSASDTESREYVVFRVADTGSGISPELVSHIFEKGYSGDGGSGLGLAICRDAVEVHGGTLEVERTGPDGTVFAFTVLRKELKQ